MVVAWNKRARGRGRIGISGGAMGEPGGGVLGWGLC